jgi:hypothetical protein
MDFHTAAKRLEHQRANLEWQRVRESNPCTSLERAYASDRIRFVVATLLLLLTAFLASRDRARMFLCSR